MLDKAEGRRRVRMAANASMSHLGWNVQDLMNASGLDRKTVTAFLDGVRWPQRETLSALERALTWPAATVATILDGGDPPDVGGDTQDPGYVTAPGESVESDVTNAELLQELRAVREDVNALSRRVARIESAAQPVGGLDGPV